LRYFQDLALEKGNKGKEWYEKKGAPYVASCHQDEPIVTKVIRFPVGPVTLQWLRQHPEIKVLSSSTVSALILTVLIFDNTFLNIKYPQVIYLVRDPRAIYNSRLQEPTGEDFSYDMELLCHLVWDHFQGLSTLSYNQ
jgi:hypothetical protein